MFGARQQSRQKFHFNLSRPLPVLTYDPQLPARYGRSEPRHQPPPIITGNTVKQLLIRPFIELCQDMEAYKGRYTSVSLPARSSRRTTGPHTGLPSTGHSAPHTHHRRSQSAPTCFKKSCLTSRWKRRQPGTQAEPRVHFLLIDGDSKVWVGFVSVVV